MPICNDTRCLFMQAQQILLRSASPAMRVRIRPHAAPSLKLLKARGRITSTPAWIWFTPCDDQIQRNATQSSPKGGGRRRREDGEGGGCREAGRGKRKEGGGERGRGAKEVEGGGGKGGR